VVRFDPRWTSWGFYLLAALLGAAVVAAALVDIDRYASGAAATDDAGRVVVLVPASLASDVKPGSPVVLGTQDVVVTGTEETVLYPAEIRRRFGVIVSVPSIAVLTSATGLEGPSSGRVLIESEPVLFALIPGLKALLGSD
jgi:hypothetical protein